MNNQELDKWIAENVMGWEYYRCITQEMNCRKKDSNGKFDVMATNYTPTSNIPHALEVAFKVDYCVELYKVSFGKSKNMIVVELMLGGELTQHTCKDLDECALKICETIKERLEDE